MVETIKTVVGTMTVVCLENQGYNRMESIYDGLFARGFSMEEAASLVRIMREFIPGLRNGELDAENRGIDLATRALQVFFQASELRHWGEPAPESDDREVPTTLSVRQASESGFSDPCRRNRSSQETRGIHSTLDCSVSHGGVWWDALLDSNIVEDTVAAQAGWGRTCWPSGSWSFLGTMRPQRPLRRVFVRYKGGCESMPYHMEGVSIEFRKSSVDIGDALYHLEELVNAQQSSKKDWINSVNHAASLCEEYLKSDFVSAKVAYHMAAVCYEFVDSCYVAQEAADHLAFLRSRCLSCSDCVVRRVNAREFEMQRCEEGRLESFSERSTSEEASSVWGESDLESESEERESSIVWSNDASSDASNGSESSSVSCSESETCGSHNWTNFDRHLAEEEESRRQRKLREALSRKHGWETEVFYLRGCRWRAQGEEDVASDAWDIPWGLCRGQECAGVRTSWEVASSDEEESDLDNGSEESESAGESSRDENSCASSSDGNSSASGNDGSASTLISESETHVGADHAEAEADAAAIDKSTCVNSFLHAPQAEAVADVVRHVGASECASRSVFAWQEGKALDSSFERGDSHLAERLHASGERRFEPLVVRCEARMEPPARQDSLDIVNRDVDACLARRGHFALRLALSYFTIPRALKTNTHMAFRPARRAVYW